MHVKSIAATCGLQQGRLSDLYLHLDRSVHDRPTCMLLDRSMLIDSAECQQSSELEIASRGRNASASRPKQKVL